VLYQLSYLPECFLSMVGRTGLEPATTILEG